MKNIEELKNYISRKIERCKKVQSDNLISHSNLSKFGYYDRGYYNGRISALEDILDELEDNVEVKVASSFNIRSVSILENGEYGLAGLIEIKDEN